MKLKKWVKVILVCASVAALSACHSRHKNMDQSDVNNANGEYGAQASGMGDESGFGDRAGRKSQRIYYFDYDSNVVHEDDKPAINSNARYLTEHRNARVLLEGHTDPRGSREYNIGLGERRAKAVADIMTSQGVNRSQIRVVSYGAQKLASPGRTEADYQQDRRVVLAYLQR